MTDSIMRIWTREIGKEPHPDPRERFEDITEQLLEGDKAALEVSLTRMNHYFESFPAQRAYPPPGGEVQLSDASEYGVPQSGEDSRCGIVRITSGALQYLVVEDDFPALYLEAGPAWTKYIPKMENGVQLLSYHYEREGSKCVSERYFVWVDGVCYTD